MRLFLSVIVFFSAFCSANEWFELSAFNNWIDINKVSKESYNGRLLPLLVSLSDFDRRKFYNKEQVKEEGAKIENEIKFVKDRYFEWQKRRLHKEEIVFVPRKISAWNLVFNDFRQIINEVNPYRIKKFVSRYSNNNSEGILDDNIFCTDRTKKVIQNIIRLICEEEKDVGELAYPYRIIVHKRNLDKVLSKLEDYNGVYSWDIDVKTCNGEEYFFVDWLKTDPLYALDDYRIKTLPLEGGLTLKMPESEQVRVQSKLHEDNKTILDLYINKNLQTRKLHRPDEMEKVRDSQSIIKDGFSYTIYPEGESSECVFVFDQDQVDKLTNLIKIEDSVDEDDWRVLACPNTEYKTQISGFYDSYDNEKIGSEEIIVQKKYLWKLMSLILEIFPVFNEGWKHKEYTAPIYLSSWKNTGKIPSYFYTYYDISGLSIAMRTSEKEEVRRYMSRSEEHNNLLNLVNIEKHYNEKDTFYFVYPCLNSNKKCLVLDSSSFEELQDKIRNCDETSLKKWKAKSGKPNCREENREVNKGFNKETTKNNGNRRDQINRAFSKRVLSKETYRCGRDNINTKKTNNLSSECINAM